MQQSLWGQNCADLQEINAANQHLTAFFGPHQLALQTKRSTLRFCHRAAKVGANSFSYLRYGAAVDISPRPLGRFYLMTVPVSGHIDLAINGSPSNRFGVADAIIINPQDQMKMRWSADCATLTLRLGEDYVRGRVSALLPGQGDMQPSFAPFSRLGNQGTQRIKTLMRMIVDDLDFSSQFVQTGDAPCAQVAIAELTDHLARFHARPVSPLDDTMLRSASSPLVRRALRIIAADTSELRSSRDLAARCQASVRTLQVYFQRELGRTPTSVLRETKLRLIRTYLTAGTQPASVTAAAMHAGWFQLDRLGAVYKSYFGELPNQTLRRIKVASVENNLHGIVNETRSI